MSRASNGTYSLPAGNPVVTGTLISSSWANTTLSDIATALTDSLSRSGDGGMSAPLELVSGAIGAPGLTFGDETTAGLYRAGAADIRFALAGADILKITSSYLLVDPKLVIGAVDTMTINGSALTSQLSVDDDTQAVFEIHTHHASAGSSAVMYGARSRGTAASPTVVSSGDYLLTLAAVGYDGTDYALGARIDFIVDGTPGSNDMPAKISFLTSPDGTQTPVQRFSIAATGAVAVDAPTSGVALNINAVSGTAAVLVNAASGSDAIIGLVGTSGGYEWDLRSDNGGAFTLRNATLAKTAISASADSEPVVSINNSGTLREAGTRDITLNTQSGATYTLVAADRGKMVYCNYAGAVTVTVPVLTAGATITLVNDTSNNITLSRSSTSMYWFNGATRSADANRTVAYGGTVTMYWFDSATVFLWGSGIS